MQEDELDFQGNIKGSSLPKISVCIANYKQDQFLQEAMDSCYRQTFKDFEIIIFNDLEGVGSGEAFNRAIAQAKGEIIILLCADDIFNDVNVFKDIVGIFTTYPNMAHVSRWYYQFVDGDVPHYMPVRAWRGNNVIELANNPSGLAFRKSAMIGCQLSNKMFIEAPFLVNKVLDIQNRFQNPFSHTILKYDTVAVRVHKSTARSKEYYRKMWTSSPVEEWGKLGWKSKDFTSLIQIKNYYSTKAVIDEGRNFIKSDVRNLFNPVFISFFIISVCVPRFILLKVPDIYRATIGRWTTREMKRK